MALRARSSLLLGALLLSPSSAGAAGLYFSDRGVRPMGRAGAFVAGADDLGALWYNPAGLVDAKSSLLADFTYLRFSDEYTRELRVLDADGVLKTVRSPTVKGSAPFLPFPTLAASYALNPRFVVAAGVYAPYAALASYEPRVNGQPSPARYALGSFDGSALALPGAWASAAPFDWLKLGLGLHAMVGRFVSEITFSASPQDRLLGAPEQPEYDATAQINAGPIFAPTFNAGAIVIPHRKLRLGVAYQHRTNVDTDASLKVRLPSSAAFDGARVTGQSATVSFTLPSILRLGVEVRPVDELRVEVAYVREFWSVHQTIAANPKDIAIEGITAGPPAIVLPPIPIPRNFRDSSSFRLGAEYALHAGKYLVQARTGIAYEQSAVPPSYLALSALDFDKITLSLGLGFFLTERLRLDALYGHIFTTDVHVRPEDAKIGRINPIQKSAPFEPVNGGSYSASADLIGLGGQYTF